MAEVIVVEESESDVCSSNISVREGILGRSSVSSKVWPKVIEVEESESDVCSSNILMEEGIRGESWVFSEVWPKVIEVEESDESLFISIQQILENYRIINFVFYIENISKLKNIESQVNW